jgi:hypothetical protein
LNFKEYKSANFLVEKTSPENIDEEKRKQRDRTLCKYEIRPEFQKSLKKKEKSSNPEECLKELDKKRKREELILESKRIKNEKGLTKDEEESISYEEFFDILFSTEKKSEIQMDSDSL